MLLGVLDTEPDRLERAFLQLFECNPADRVLRLLDEDTSLAEEALLVATLPPAPFLRAMTRQPRARSRDRCASAGGGA